MSTLRPRFHLHFPLSGGGYVDVVIESIDRSTCREDIALALQVLGLAAEDLPSRAARAMEAEDIGAEPTP